MRSGIRENSDGNVKLQHGILTNSATGRGFDTERLADDDASLRRFVFLLGADRVVPGTGKCHFYGLREESEKVGRELTKEFYARYADMRQDAFEQLSRDNPTAARHDVLSCTQKALDRVLFVAFAEDRGLLPTETIRKAYEHHDPYHPREGIRSVQPPAMLQQDLLTLKIYRRSVSAPAPSHKLRNILIRPVSHKSKR